MSAVWKKGQGLQQDYVASPTFMRKHRVDKNSRSKVDNGH